MKKRIIFDIHTSNYLCCGVSSHECKVQRFGYFLVGQTGRDASMSGPISDNKLPYTVIITYRAHDLSLIHI